MAGIGEQTRIYQRELTELAITSNIIIVLDTGSGKTHIAAQVLCHYENIELQRREAGTSPRQISFFLVPTVTLVEQQTEYVSGTLRKKPRAICGAIKDLDRWIRADWKTVLNSHTVIVCTGEILNQALALRHVTVPEINLIIFDEAHHAKGGDSYSGVMKRCKESPSPRKPRIIGMTASPVQSTDRIEEDLMKLERLLEAQIVTSSDGSLLQHVHRPTEEQWDYFGLQRTQNTDLQVQLQQYVDMEALKNTCVNIGRVSRELGTWCGNMGWSYALDDTQIYKIKRRIEGEDLEHPRPKSQVSTELRRLDTAISIVRAYDFTTTVLNPTPLVSDKVLVLHKKLQAVFESRLNMSCIIFVRERTTARALTDVFMELLPVHGMRATYLVGMSAGEIGDATSSWNRQKSTLKDFRNGSVNCLFATQVAEEGIDIPSCNLVVRFNPYENIIQYVQSRGRAREKDSVYAVMHDIHKKNEAPYLQYIRDCELYLRRYYAEMSPERLVNLREATLRGGLSSKYRDLFFTTQSGAKCDLDNSLPFLEHFARSLQYENIAANRVRFAEVPGKKFSFVAHVPIDASRAVFPGAPFKSKAAFNKYLDNLPSDGGAKFFEVKGLEIYHKGLAKRSAGLEANRALRSMGLLDENLDSIHKKKLEAMDHVRLPNMEKALTFDVKVRADFWNIDAGREPDILYGTTFSFKFFTNGLQKRHSPIVFLSRRPLPAITPFPLLLEDDVEVTVLAHQHAGPFPVGKSDLDLLTLFTLDGVYLDVFNKRFEKDTSKMQYWLAPAGQFQRTECFKDLVDVGQLNAIHNGLTPWNPSHSNAQSWCNKFLVAGWHSRIARWTYFTEGLVEDATVDSPVPVSAANVIGKTAVASKTANVSKIAENVLAFTAWNGYSPVDRNQPVLNATLTSFRRDFRVAASKDEKDKKSTVCHICPQPLKVSSLVPDFARSCLLFPSIWCHINDRLIANEVSQKLGLSIPTELVVEAITYVTEEQIHSSDYDLAVLDYPNKNYERLEFYGDTFLKLAVVLVLFIKFDKETALNYHVKKKELISNHNLSNVVRHVGLDRYMRSGQVERREIWPANVALLNGKAAREETADGTVKRSLRQKSIADVAEALIGATLLTSFDQPNSTRFDVPLQAVTKLVQSDHHDVTAWSQYTDLYNPPNWQSFDRASAPAISDAEEISKILGYKFRYPNLARSAVTHKSYAKGNIPNYERLEILGDGLYDMVVADFLFHKYPRRGPQFLTEHKDVMVSNKFMAYLGVKLGLNRYIIYASSAAQVARCNSYVAQYRNAVDVEEMDKKDLNFWYELESEPKIFADVIESLIGAMFVDSGFDFGVVEHFFETHVLQYFQDEALHTEVSQAHPVTTLVMFLKGRFRCSGFRNAVTNEGFDRDNQSLIKSVISVHKVVLAEAEATSGKVAKARAARKGMDELKKIAAMGEGPKEYIDRFACHCKWDWEGDVEAEDDPVRETGKEEEQKERLLAPIKDMDANSGSESDGEDLDNGDYVNLSTGNRYSTLTPVKRHYPNEPAIDGSLANGNSVRGAKDIGNGQKVNGASANGDLLSSDLLHGNQAKGSNLNSYAGNLSSLKNNLTRGNPVTTKESEEKKAKGLFATRDMSIRSLLNDNTVNGNPSNGNLGATKSVSGNSGHLLDFNSAHSRPTHADAPNSSGAIGKMEDDTEEFLIEF